MYEAQPKKMLIINILEILRKYSDNNHRLSQKDIVDILLRDYDMKVDRKAVKRNLMNLIDFDYNIEYSEVARATKNTKTGMLEDNTILTDFFLIRDFDDSELRLLIDSLLFSKHIPYSQCKELIHKLESLSSKYFEAKVKHIRTMPVTYTNNKLIFYVIEILDEAINSKKQVKFTYGTYGVDKKLHPRSYDDGTVREYIVNPYQIAAANGRYYLIGNYDKYDNVSHYRLDRIMSIELLEQKQKLQKNVKGLEKGFNLPKHMAEHIYMFSGDSEVVTFRFKKYLLNDVMDYFGSAVTFFDETEENISARVKVKRSAMQKWALQYALHAKILSPSNLAEAVKNDLEKAYNSYCANGEHT